MKKRSSFVGAVVAAALFCSQAEATSITFFSGDGGDIVNGGTAVPITPVAVWGDVSVFAGLAPGTAAWISYANTGSGPGGLVAPNAAGRAIGQQTALFSRTFELLEVSTFSLWALADDTATVQLVGPGGTANLFTAVAGQIDPCAPGGTGVAIGCMQADMGFALANNLAAGLYTLNLYAFQTNFSVFGAQYAGIIQSRDEGPITPVPEPGTLILIGTGVVGLVANRKRRRASRPLSVSVSSNR